MGIIIVAICSLVPCFIGYELIHVYERYAWILVTIIMLFLWGLGGHAGFDINAQKPLEDKGKDLAADVLSFGGIVFGSFTGVGPIFRSSSVSHHSLLKWAPVAADYNYRLPVDTPPMTMFLLTVFGL